MSRIRILFLTIAVFLLSGCANQAHQAVVVQNQLSDTGKHTNEDSTKTNTDSSQTSAVSASKLPEEKNSSVTQNVYKAPGKETESTISDEATHKQESVPDPNTMIGQRTYKVEKLDTSVLDKLEYKSYSWWISLNHKHLPTGIPTTAKTLIGKYGGVYLGDTSKKVVYLTFDEGYENGYTAQILDTLKKEDVRALFFVTGPYIKTQKELIRRMLDEGHQVGNHTINHLSLPTLNDGALENEMFGLEKQFRSMYGTGFKYMRPPKGEYSERVLAAAQQLGYTTVFWSYAYNDYDTKNQKGADHAYKMVMDNLHNGAVILLHAVSRDNAEALDRIITSIREKGYEIKPFDL